MTISGSAGRAAAAIIIDRRRRDAPRVISWSLTDATIGGLIKSRD